MKKLTRNVIENYALLNDEDISECLSEIYLNVLDEFAPACYPKGSEEETLICSIHDNFKNGHNCVACNLQEYTTLLLKFLSGYKNFVDVHLTSTHFHLLLYLLVERYNEYFRIINIQDFYKQRYFKVFQRITQWANFLKHPKALMLSHHAFYWIKGMEYNSEHWFYDKVEDAKKHNKIIDDKFVKEYYSGDKNNGKLYKLLSKKEDFIVVFPNPIELIKEFTTAQNKFVTMINENEIIREILDDKATIIEYFENKNSEEE